MFVEKGCISEVSSKPKVVVNSLHLTEAGKKASKSRLVLNARHDNLFKYKHQYETRKLLSVCLCRKSIFFSFDLKSSYHFIKVHELSIEYLGFKWKNIYYVFDVLPFGISKAGYSFTKVMRKVVKFWRSKEIMIVMYLDDGIGGDLVCKKQKGQVLRFREMKRNRSFSCI